MLNYSLSMNDNSDLKYIVINRKYDDKLQDRYNSTIVTTIPVFGERTFEDYLQVKD